MAEVTIRIGGREFDVACEDGEEHFLESAAAMLDAEAQALVDQIGQIPDSRMLLMAGLMLADKTAAAEDAARAAEDRVRELEADRDAAADRPAAMPEGLTEDLAALAERAETVAEIVERRAAG